MARKRQKIRKELPATETGKPADKKEQATGNPGRARRFYNQSQLLFLVAGLVVLAVGIGLYAVQRKPEPPKQEASEPDPNDELAYRQQILRTTGYEATSADYLILGNEYVTRNDYAGAEAQYKQAEKLDGTSIDVMYALAQVYRLQKNKDATLAYYDKIIAAASKDTVDRHTNLELYRAERQAIVSGDFELKQVEYSHELPL